MRKRVHVVVNPAAGSNEPILNTLNDIFRRADIWWDVSVTHAKGDALRATERALADGVDVVAAYGGDDTVAEVAAALSETHVPLAILPGGTGNGLAKELEIPLNLTRAASLIAGSNKTRKVDLGRTGDRVFVLRVTFGSVAEIVLRTDREVKDRIGTLAYVIAGLQAMGQPKEALYRIQMDDETVEMYGVGCLIANSAKLGLLGLKFSWAVGVDDGLLDVVMVRGVDVPTMAAVAASTAGLEAENKDALPHWQARAVRVTAEPAQATAIDGEPFKQTPVEAEILPGALEVIVPERVGQNLPQLGGLRSRTEE